MDTKICTKCKVEKPVSDFHKDKHQLDGFHSYCKSCRSAINRLVNERLLQNPEYRERVYENNRKYRQREKYKEWDRKRSTTKERLLQKLVNNRKRRAKKKGFNEIYNEQDIQYTFDLFNNACINCGSTERLEIDHHYPFNEGNLLTRTNAVLLCKSCNCKKHIKSPEEFYTIEKLNEIHNILYGEPNLTKGAKCDIV